MAAPKSKDKAKTPAKQDTSKKELSPVKDPKNWGRPRKYKTPAEFDKRVNEYFQYCERDGQPVLWTGLCLWLGFTSRVALDRYADYPEFSNSVKRAKMAVQAAYEQRASGNNAAGPIFVLKNMGWSDRQEITGAGGGPVQLAAVDATRFTDRALNELLEVQAHVSDGDDDRD